jgi:hypothetical protein
MRARVRMRRCACVRLLAWACAIASGVSMRVPTRVRLLACSCVWVCAYACTRAYLRVCSVRLRFAPSAALSCLRLGYPLTRGACASLRLCLVPLRGSLYVTLLRWLALGCKGGGIEKRDFAPWDLEGPLTLHRGILVQVGLSAGSSHGWSFALCCGWVCAGVRGYLRIQAGNRVLNLRSPLR